MAECYTTVAALPRCSFAALQRCSQIIGNTRETLEYARVTLDGVTALDLLCSPPSEFFGGSVEGAQAAGLDRQTDAASGAYCLLQPPAGRPTSL